MLAAALPGTAAADPVADFYQGRNVSMIIGFPPGGGYDAYARAIAAHIGDHIPGKPHVVVQNMPGASSLRAANFIFNTAPRDGTAMGAFSAGTVFAPLLGNKKAKFVSTKFTWIGNSEKSVGTCAVWHTSKIKSLNDLLSHPGIFGASGVTGVMSEFPRAMDALIGARARVIHGYAGGTGVLLAMERGEVDGSCAMALSTLKSVRHDDWKSGRLVVLVQLGLEPEPDLKGVPSIYDYARSDDDRKAMEVIFGRQTLGRPIGAPPGLQPDITKALRAAFEATMTDPAFLADAEKRRLNIEPMSGAQVDKLVARFQFVLARRDRAREQGARGRQGRQGQAQGAGRDHRQGVEEEDDRDRRQWDGAHRQDPRQALQGDHRRQEKEDLGAQGRHEMSPRILRRQRPRAQGGLPCSAGASSPPTSFPRAGTVTIQPGPPLSRW